jgi:transposase-like protein
VDAAIGQLLLEGLSIRRLKSIARDLFGASLGAGTASAIASFLDADLQAYQINPSVDDTVFLFLDGTSQKVKEIGVEGWVMLRAFGTGSCSRSGGSMRRTRKMGTGFWWI